MLKGAIDLHLHTTCSDGLDTPEELVETAVSNGYSVISITDHDTVDGVIRGMAAARGTPLELIPGIELSSLYDEKDVHIIGYYIDCDDKAFIKRIQFFMEKRYERAEEIVICLNYLGLDLSIETVLKVAHGAPIGRPHIAEALLSENLTTTYNEAFALYIGTYGPAYVPKYKVTPQEAIDLILNNGGIPVIAHPGSLNRDKLIEELIECGLMGIEVIHPVHTLEKQRYYQKLADKYGLIATGGSDWHGKARTHYRRYINSSFHVPEKTISQLKLLVNSRKDHSGKRTAEKT